MVGCYEEEEEDKRDEVDATTIVEEGLGGVGNISIVVGVGLGFEVSGWSV